MRTLYYLKLTRPRALVGGEWTPTKGRARILRVKVIRAPRGMGETGKKWVMLLDGDGDLERCELTDCLDAYQRNGRRPADPKKPHYHPRSISDEFLFESHEEAAESIPHGFMRF